MRTLYLCYFGLREPLVETQVLPYLRELVAGGIEVSLLTFEPAMRARWNEGELQGMRARLMDDGIRWHALPYHKRPSLPATLHDIAAGAWYAGRLARREKIGIFHARSHVAAAMGALAKRMAGGKLIFDIRGFMPEEYTDAGVWPEGGWLYRGVKAVERRLLDFSDAFVMLTEKAREILFPGCEGQDERGRPIEVIPCCIDPRRFAHRGGRETTRRQLGLEGRRVIVYTGSFGGWYLTDEMIEFFAEAYRQDRSSFAMVLTQSDAGELKRRLIEAGLAEADFLVRRLAPDEVPRYLEAADIALSFIKRCYSKQASSPTKVAEYLVSGLPVVSNAGIGDLDELIEHEQVGKIVRAFTPAQYDLILREMDQLRAEQGLNERCRRVALAKFDLAHIGGVRYRRLYERLNSDAAVSGDDLVEPLQADARDGVRSWEVK